MAVLVDSILRRPFGAGGGGAGKREGTVGAGGERGRDAASGNRGELR
jgi:hypothetical protein